MADLRSAEVGSVPNTIPDLMNYIEEHLRDHYEDIKQLKQMIDLQEGFRLAKDSDGNMIIEEFIIETQLWTDTGWQLGTMQ